MGVDLEESDGAQDIGNDSFFPFYDPSSGQILINQDDVKDVDISSLRNNIALVSQDTIIYNKSFLDNIKFGNLEAKEKKVKEIINKYI